MSSAGVQRFFPSKKIGNLSENLFGSGSFSATGGTVSLSSGYIVHTFNMTGSDQQFTVSQLGSAKKIEIFMWGAAGGGSNGEGYSDPGGAGGYSYGEYFIQNTGSLIVQVGQGGGRSTVTPTRPSRPYPNGGLPALRQNYISGAGGGRSAIFLGSVSAQNALLIAGGGGGGAGHGGGSSYATEGGHGGAGGGTIGESGYSTYQTETPNGATQSAAGTTSTSPNIGAQPGGQLQGADAGNGTAWSTGWNSTGGGGDGWYGGGAIEGKHQGGGGGSGYAAASILAASLQSATTNNTRISNTSPPQTSNQFYVSGIGAGSANADGGNGLVVIRYLV